MTNAWMDIFKDEIDEKIDASKKKDLFIYVQDGAMKIEYAAGRANQSVAEFAKEMEEKGYKVPKDAMVNS